MLNEMVSQRLKGKEKCKFSVKILESSQLLLADISSKTKKQAIHSLKKSEIEWFHRNCIFQKKFR